MSLTPNLLNLWGSNFANSATNTMIQNALTNNSYKDLFLNRNNVQSTEYTYSVQVKPHCKVTNQRASGRCWMFAAMNIIRVYLMDKYKLEDFEFSQSFVFFNDKLERSNYFLDSITNLKVKGHDQLERTLNKLLYEPISDGGQWDMFASLVNKYGLLPKSIFQESRHSSHSAELNSVLKRLLREYAMKLWNMENVDDMHNVKMLYMENVYQLLVKFLGTPPTQFDWTFMDKDKKLQRINNLSPKKFYDEIVKPLFNVTDYVSIIHDPRPKSNYNRAYTVEYLGSVVEAPPIRHLNLDIARVKELVKQSLNNNSPVWFGCDVGKEYVKSQASLDTTLIDYTPFGVNFTMNKAEKLLWCESLMTHAMVFTGYYVNKDDKIIRWEVENSWGSEGFNSGYLMMSDNWFDEYVYQIVVNINSLSENEVNAYKGTTITLPVWDPFGALAKLY